MAEQDFVRLELEKGRRIKLQFKHKQLREAVRASGNRPIGELLSDPFGGWPFLLVAGYSAFKGVASLDEVSDWIDVWMDQPDPTTGEPRTLDQLGMKLIEAIKASGFIKTEPVKDQDDEGAEGNAQAT